VLYEEFGVNTQWPDGPSRWVDLATWDGGTRKASSPRKSTRPSITPASCPRLQRMGCLGAFAWCFPDYHQSLWDRPPCDFQAFERFFGLYRPDGSIKPMGKVVSEFAKGKPTVAPSAEKTVPLPVPPDEYYRDPWKLLRGCTSGSGRWVEHPELTRNRPQTNNRFPVARAGRSPCLTEIHGRAGGRATDLEP
jgi:hypothetical protein